jgi:hypothetical protein
VKRALLFSLLLVASGGVGAGCGDGVDRRPATWSYLSPVVFQPSCATPSCHSPAASVAGLDFSTPHNGYASLTRLWIWVVDPTGEGGSGCGMADGIEVCEKQYRPLVVPFSPQESKLVNMLRGRGAARMPPDRPLDEADIQLVERWILNGAKEHESDTVEVPEAGAEEAGEAGAQDADAGDVDEAGEAGADAGNVDGGAADAGVEAGG